MAAFDPFGDFPDADPFGAFPDAGPSLPTTSTNQLSAAPLSARPQFAFTPEDRDIAIRTVFGEAEGGGPDEMAAVAQVLKNRALAARTSLADEALKKNQFEPWMHPDRRKRMLDLTPDDAAYRQVAAVLDPILNGEVDDITGGATHFYAPEAQKALGRKPPQWDNGSGR